MFLQILASLNVCVGAGPDAVGTALGVEGQTQCSLALKASLDSAAQSTLCFLPRPPCGQKRRRRGGGGVAGEGSHKAATVLQKGFNGKKISSFSLEFQVRNVTIPGSPPPIPPVVSDSFITPQRRAVPDKGISTPPPSLETGLAVKRRPLVSGGAQHGAVIKGSRAAADPRSPPSLAPPKRKEAHRGLEFGGRWGAWGGVGGTRCR